MRSGTVILLNGSSSSGKTTLAKALQQALPEPCQHMALDHFRDGLPDKLRGMNAPAGASGAAGLNVVPGHDGTAPITHIRFGDTGRRVKRAMRRAVVAMAEQGLDVVVDDLLLSPADLDDYATVLESHVTYLIRVHAPLATLTSREQSRAGRFPGTARSHYESVHAHGASYDLEVDTSLLRPAAAAQAVAARLEQPPIALDSYRKAQASR